MEKIYFGHPINYYNTDKESELIRIIQFIMPEYEIENPNQPHHQAGYQRWKEKGERGMRYYFEEVLPNMDAGIFLAFDDGMFGAGVFGEAEFLYKDDKPIYEISLDGEISDLVLDESRFLSIEETRKRVHN